MDEEYQTEVILKVNEIKVATQYGKAALTTEPVGDLMYLIKVPSIGWEEKEDGSRVFTVEGIRHIVKGLQVALVIDASKEDF